MEGGKGRGGGGASSETGEGLDCGVSSLVHPAATLAKNSANGLDPVPTSLPPCLQLATSGKVEQKYDFGLEIRSQPTPWGKFDLKGFLPLAF